MSVRGVGLTAGLMALIASYAIVAPTAVATTPDRSRTTAMRQVAEKEPIRQTEQAAAAYAAEIGERVEIGSQRGERRTVYANPDGTRTAIEHTQPVRVVRDGVWTPVDATLVVSSDGTLVPKAATFGLRLSAGGDGPLLTADRAGRAMSLVWPSELPKPTVTGSRASYAEVLPGVDLVVNVTPDSFSHVLVIKNAKAAADPRLAEITFGLRTTGVTVAENATGSLTVTDAATGGAVFEAPPPTMWDSPTPPVTTAAKSAALRADSTPQKASVAGAADTSTEVPLGVEVGADAVTLVPDRAMLTDPATTFPVYLDPVFATSKRSAYTMVASGYENESYWSFDGKKDEGVGECPVSSGTCNGAGVKRLFYTVPTPYLGADILSAKFAVTMVHTYDSSEKDVSLWRADRGISSATTWNNQPGMVELMDTVSPTGKRDACENGNQNVRFNVADAFDNINDKKLKAVTFAMRAASETDHTAWKRFCGNGQLEVTYNHKPAVPSTATMRSAPGGTCVTGSTVPTLSTWPTLYVYVKDSDHSTVHKEEVRARVRLTWTKSDGTAGTWTSLPTAYKAGDGKTPFQFATPSSVPQNIPISWQAAGGDTANGGNSWSAYSTPACKFIVDTTAPPEPDIDSPDFLPLDKADDGTATASACQADPEDRGYAGLYSSFTFDVPGTDAVRYLYGFDEEPTHELIPRKADGTVNPGGPVTVRWMAEKPGTRMVTVRAYDKANNPSRPAVCYFGVPTRLAAAEWKLDEQAGAQTAEDARGQNSVTVPAAVGLGKPGPGCLNMDPCARDLAARFSGEPGSYLATGSSALIDTRKPFTVAAWVKLADDGQDRVVVSQDGTGVPGFTLGLDAASKKWAFKTATNDVRSLGGWVSRSDAPAVKNEWTHLAGVYDAEKGTLQLYVNGSPQKTTAPRRTVYASRGAMQIGRSLERGHYRGFWQGDLADVAAYDRVVTATELLALAKRRPIRLAYWQLNAASGGKSPEATGATARDLLLEGDAYVRAVDPDDPRSDSALIGTGELILDGVDDRARTTGPVAPMDGSFAVTAYVRLASDGCARNMSVVSQAGTKNSGFRIRCTADDLWQLVVPSADDKPTGETTVTDQFRLPSGDAGGQHLAIVYDAFERTMRFYVAGELVDTETAIPDGVFNATGAFQVGRALINGTFGEYFGGAVDDVRVYAGVLDDQTIANLAVRAEQPNL